jgi:hypothetical protein
MSFSLPADRDMILSQSRTEQALTHEQGGLSWLSDNGPGKHQEIYAAGDSLVICGVFSSAVYMKNPRGEILLLGDEKYGLVPFGVGVKDAEALVARGPSSQAQPASRPAGLRAGQNGIFAGVRTRAEERMDPPEGAALAAASKRARPG